MFSDDYRDDRRYDRGHGDRERDMFRPDGDGRRPEPRGFARNEGWRDHDGHRRQGPPPERRPDLRDERDPRFEDRPARFDDRTPPHDGPLEDGRRGGAWDFGRTDRRYSLEDTRRALPMEETERLIASDKVEGTAVYDMTGRRVGEVRCFMVEKRTGRAEYAVVRIRGGLVSGETYRPVDWRDLHYHERLDGYQIDMARQDLRRDRSFEERR